MADILHSIVTRIDTTANWTTLNPTPANGEQCIEILGRGLFKLKVGDGVTPWLALNYATVNGDVSGLKTLLKKEIEERKEGDQHLQELLDQLDIDIQAKLDELDDKKLDKVVDTPNIIYGTDENGNQTVYDKESFGQVDDVQLNGVSVVENKIANIEPEAADIAYTNDQYPSMQTLQDAMDKLLYITPAVSISGGGTYEIGSSRSSVSLSWNWNKKISSQSLNQGIGELEPSLRSYVYTPENPITTNTTFTISGTDGTTSKSASTTVSFSPKRYWGVSANTSLTDAEIIALSQEFSTSRTQSRTFNCSGGKYFYFAIKTSYCNGIAFKVGGLSFSDMLVETRQFTNASGHTDSYNIYRVNNIQTGAAIAVEVL